MSAGFNRDERQVAEAKERLLPKIEMEIIMNDAIKKGMKEHITATVQGSDGNRKSWAKLDSGKWVAVRDNGDLDDFEIRPEDFYELLCIFRDSGRQVVFNDHSAV